MVASAKKLAETFRISIFAYAECGSNQPFTLFFDHLLRALVYD